MISNFLSSFSLHVKCYPSLFWTLLLHILELFRVTLIFGEKEAETGPGKVPKWAVYSSIHIVYSSIHIVYSSIHRYTLKYKLKTETRMYGSPKIDYIHLYTLSYRFWAPYARIYSRIWKSYTLHKGSGKWAKGPEN